MPGFFPSSSSVLHKFRATNSIKIQLPHSRSCDFLYSLLFVVAVVAGCPRNKNANSFHFVVHNILLLMLVGSSGFPTCRHLFVANFSSVIELISSEIRAKKPSLPEKRSTKNRKRKELTQKQMEMPINGTPALRRKKNQRRKHKHQIFEIRACFCNGNGTLLVSCLVSSLRYSCYRCHCFFLALSSGLLFRRCFA